METVYEIFLDENNLRMAVVMDYKLNKQVVRPFSGHFDNFYNMDVGDTVSFESNADGWVSNARVVRIIGSPMTKDEYILEYIIDGKTKQETIEGQYMPPPDFDYDDMVCDCYQCHHESRFID